ncbi:MAG: hypothetical protein V3T49_09200 [Dehalococcoidia bacterium]
MTSKSALVVLAALTLVLVACATNTPPGPDNDSPQSYRAGTGTLWWYEGERIPVDDNVYDITGEVVADVENLTRQISPSGYVRGAYFDPLFAGKGFVRLLVHSVTPSTSLATPERIVLIKTSDTKASALLPNDVVTFRCRAQYEAVGAVRDNEHFDVDKVGTWELDYCRMATPVITPK